MTIDPLKYSVAGVLRIYGSGLATAPAPLVMDCPHSGRLYPADFDYVCDPQLLHQAEDNHVDALLEGTGLPLLVADFPRTYIDVNRAIDDIEGDLLAEPWPTQLNPSSRSRIGAGLIRRLVENGIPVYNRKFFVREIQQRIDKYYIPYHEALGKLLDETHAAFGQVWHLNWHSMPDSAQPGGLPDFVLGDCDSTTCDPAFTRAVRDFLKKQGYSVALNHPYKGAELVSRHSDPSRGRHSLQIEINKRLYWDETMLIKTNKFNLLKENVHKLVEFCCAWPSTAS